MLWIIGLVVVFLILSSIDRNAQSVELLRKEIERREEREQERLAKIEEQEKERKEIMEKSDWYCPSAFTSEEEEEEDEAQGEEREELMRELFS